MPTHVSTRRIRSTAARQVNSGRVSRRGFLVTSSLAAAVAGVGFWSEVARGEPRSALEKLRLGAIGVGHRANVHLTEISGEDVVALCDVDDRSLDPVVHERFPSAATYHDFREMLERERLDAVVVTTPNHTHFHASLLAVRRGLHVYCEKPLAHSVDQLRRLATAARERGVVTQTGNQHHSSDGYRRAVELVQAGVVGEVREIHSWTSRPWWPQGIGRPAETPATPDELHWDLWLGPAPERPYHPAYHPVNWRGWWDFGDGALGDMGPHLLDPAVWALELGAPTTIAAESSPVNAETAPEWSIVRFEFPQRGKLPPVRLTWYDGGKQPPDEVTRVRRLPAHGTLLLGSRARLFIPQLGKPPVLVPNDKDDRIEQPQPYLPVSPGHQQQWLLACKGEGQTGSDFTYGANLTEICLLGNIAIRTGKKLAWDAAQMTVTNCPEANQFLRRDYRPGWELD